MGESEGVNLLFQKEHLLLDFMTQNEIYAAGFLSWGLRQRARRQDLCLRRERGVGLNHSFFMNDQGQYRLGLQESVCKVDNDGSVQEIWAKSSGKCLCFF